MNYHSRSLELDLKTSRRVFIKQFSLHAVRI